jgi:hypothetical protein
MRHSIASETQSLEDAFFRKRDAELVAEMRRREATETRKRALAEVSGITDESVLNQLVAHDIHVETLAAFSLVPILKVAWADGKIQAAERSILLRAISEAGIPKDGIAYRLMQEWLEQRPAPKLMKLWRDYTQALMRQLPPEIGEPLKQTVLGHARAVAEAAGGFLGLGRISHQEEKVLAALEEAFIIQSI